jgi:hypothetical protein
LIVTPAEDYREGDFGQRRGSHGGLTREIGKVASVRREPARKTDLEPRPGHTSLMLR